MDETRKQTTSTRMNQEQHDETVDLSLEEIDYKNVAFMKRFMTSAGRVLSRRATSLTAKKQRKMAKEVKKMKFLALVPYCDRHKK